VTRVLQRKIIHVDMDAFYASVEQRDHPELRGRPLAVGGSDRRGVVAAASYEARAYGVRSAMPSVTARRRCPDLVFVAPRFERYREVSRAVHAIFRRYSDTIEPLSLDEAYLDVSEDRQGIGSAVEIARRIRADIRTETGLTASAGVSYNKFLAKVASDQNKPDGLFVVLPGDGAEFVAGLPARRFHGVGPKTAARMAGLGIHSGADIRDCSLAFLQRHFGRQALYLYRASRGRDERPVRASRQRKSLGAERTWSEDLRDAKAIHAALMRIVDTVWTRSHEKGVTARTVTLKVRYEDFSQLSRALTPAAVIDSRDALASAAETLLARLSPTPLGIRLLGLTLSGLDGGAPGDEDGPEPVATGTAEPPSQYQLHF
jgi:DNA polymerase-4